MLGSLRRSRRPATVPAGTAAIDSDSYLATVHTAKAVPETPLTCRELVTDDELRAFAKGKPVVFSGVPPRDMVNMLQQVSDMAAELLARRATADVAEAPAKRGVA